MDLSMRWLADYVDCDMPIKEFVSGLTISGSKVERYGEEGDFISNVVVGKVLSTERHPDSDHMFITMVDVGEGEPLQIVTGAQNVSVGDYVPVAKHKSTVLHEGKQVKITNGKLRGVASNGMLCSLSELGLTVHDFPYAIEDGIFILGEDCDRTVGMDIRKAIGFDDTQVEFEITSNRPDCMSVIGLARETAATFDKKLDIKEPVFNGIDGNIADYLKVQIHDPKLCQRYMAGIVKNVKIEPSPRWMRERLRASGVRPINNLVDITNYVMLEYGHPMHAFDLRYVKGGEINIRHAQKGESIMTLDGVERALSEEMLVIADAEKPAAVAGVMGGEYSGIMDDTVTVVFESACFDGASVRTTAKKLGMRTDASARFEKGLNAQQCVPALMRALQLVEILKAGEPLKEIIDCDCSDHTPASAPFDAKKINAFLGTDIAEEDMIKYLEKLEFTVKDGLATAPYYRIDIENMSDIAEEVARLYGYNNIPSEVIRGTAQAMLTPKHKFEREVKRVMTALGFNEITTYSFISPKYLDRICLSAESKLRKAVTITNPLGEDTSIMRTTALPSMCEILSKNYSNRNACAYLFELGNEYIPVEGEELPSEPPRLTIGFYNADGSDDFFTLKGAVETLLDRVGCFDVEYEAAAEGCGFDEVSAFHPGRVAVAKKDGQPIGVFGELSFKCCENYGIGTRCYAAKIDLDRVMEMSTTERVYKPLPKFPAVTRDVSVVCDDGIPVASLEKAIKNAVGKILESVKLFDVYKGKQVEDGKKSVSYSIVMRSHEGTLTDEQADAAMKKVLKALGELGAKIRE